MLGHEKLYKRSVRDSVQERDSFPSGENREASLINFDVYTYIAVYIRIYERG